MSKVGKIFWVIVGFIFLIGIFIVLKFLRTKTATGVLSAEAAKDEATYHKREAEEEKIKELEEKTHEEIVNLLSNADDVKSVIKRGKQRLSDLFQSKRVE